MWGTSLMLTWKGESFSFESGEVSSGPDTRNIHPTPVKGTKSETVDALKSLFNFSLGRGLVPADWKTANVTELHPGTRGLLA